MMRQDRRVQAGFMLLEVIISAALLAATAAIVLQLLAVAARDRALTAQRQAAESACVNAAERVQALPWQQLDEAALAEWQLSDEELAALPGGRLEVDVAEGDESLLSRQVTVRVAWDSQSTGESRATQLVVWRFDPGEVAP